MKKIILSTTLILGLSFSAFGMSCGDKLDSCIANMDWQLYMGYVNDIGYMQGLMGCSGQYVACTHSVPYG